MSDAPPSPADLARGKLAARAARISRLRRRVAAGGLATFAVAFGAIAYDGSMGTATSSTVSRRAAATSTRTTSSGDAGSATPDIGSAAAASSSSSNDDSSSTSALTTRQS